jgi:hypothetical protein
MIQNETLEEVAKIISKEHYVDQSDYWAIGVDSFKRGAKWQAERMYSEEEVREAFRQGQDNMDYSEMYGWSSKLTEQEWFEQFKKKTQ